MSRIDGQDDLTLQSDLQSLARRARSSGGRVVTAILGSGDSDLVLPAAKHLISRMNIGEFEAMLLSMSDATTYSRSRLPAAPRTAIYARQCPMLQNAKRTVNQIERCKCAIDQRGWRLAGIYQDNGQGGVSLDRPGFKMLMQAVENAELDVVLVTSLDRVGRDARWVRQAHADMRENSVLLLTLNDLSRGAFA